MHSLDHVVKTLDAEPETHRRQGRGGKSFDYLKIGNARRDLQEAFGLNYDSKATLVHHSLREVIGSRNGKRTVSWCAVAICQGEVTVRWLDDSGAEKTCTHVSMGVCTNTCGDAEEALATAVKGADSDAIKRAAWPLGRKLGLYLRADDPSIPSEDGPAYAPQDDVLWSPGGQAQPGYHPPRVAHVNDPPIQPMGMPNHQQVMQSSPMQAPPPAAPAPQLETPMEQALGDRLPQVGDPTAEELIAAGVPIELVGPLTKVAAEAPVDRMSLWTPTWQVVKGICGEEIATASLAETGHVPGSPITGKKVRQFALNSFSQHTNPNPKKEA